MEKPRFIKKYGTLYQNVATDSWPLQLHTSIFCTKRILIAVVTCFLPNSAIVDVSTYIWVSLASISYVVLMKPLVTKMLNQIEVFNELAILVTGYFMMCFTKWIPDINFRYTLGKYYNAYIIAVLAGNFGIIIYNMGLQIRRAYVIRKRDRAWEAHYLRKDLFIKALIEEVEAKHKLTIEQNDAAKNAQMQLLSKLSVMEMSLNMGKVERVLLDVRQNAHEFSFGMDPDREEQYVACVRGERVKRGALYELQK